MKKCPILIFIIIKQEVTRYHYSITVQKTQY